jgi:acetyl/propionyl-CoA carboxylase alpha subunit
VEQGAKEAERIGFPLAVKAAFGGGGKGMRVVHDPAEVGDALERSAREAQAYFGRPRCTWSGTSRWPTTSRPRSSPTRTATCPFLGERDCSLQRRYQKLVEETPSPVVDEDLRNRIGEAALAIAKEAGYVNAGTVEFLVERAGRSTSWR